MAQRLPVVGSDDNTWGTILNGYLTVAHNADGTAYTITLITNSSSPYIIANESPPNVNEFILANASAGAVTVTLPDATNSTYNEFLYTVKKTDTSLNFVTVNTTNSQTIDGGLTAQLKVPYVSVSVVSDGSNWNVV